MSVDMRRGSVWRSASEAPTGPCMQMADVTDVCVVVSRWFGGVHLGPSRFAIINNTARQLLVQEGFMPSGATRGKGKK